LLKGEDADFATYIQTLAKQEGDAVKGVARAAGR
jgi:hypothetical protein